METRVVYVTFLWTKVVLKSISCSRVFYYKFVILTALLKLSRFALVARYHFNLFCSVCQISLNCYKNIVEVILDYVLWVVGVLHIHARDVLADLYHWESGIVKGLNRRAVYL